MTRIGRMVADLFETRSATIRWIRVIRDLFHPLRSPIYFSFPRSCVGMPSRTLLRPLCDAGASRWYTPTEDRGSEQGEEVRHALSDRSCLRVFVSSWLLSQRLIERAPSKRTPIYHFLPEKQQS